MPTIFFDFFLEFLSHRSFVVEHTFTLHNQKIVPHLVKNLKNKIVSRVFEVMKIFLEYKNQGDKNQNGGKFDGISGVVTLEIDEFGRCRSKFFS